MPTDTQKTVIDHCASVGSDLIMMVDGFQTEDEALLLRDMLWYAKRKGVPVIFVPNKKE